MESALGYIVLRVLVPAPFWAAILLVRVVNGDWQAITTPEALGNLRQYYIANGGMDRGLLLRHSKSRSGNPVHISDFHRR